MNRPGSQPGEQPGVPAADAGRLRKLLGPPEMAWLVERIRAGWSEASRSTEP